MNQISKILYLSSQHLDIPVSAFTSRDRQRNYAEGRYMLMSILHGSFRMTLSQIGTVTERDHTTVLHGLKKMTELREAYPDVNEKYLKLRELVYEKGLQENVRLSGYCNQSKFEFKRRKHEITESYAD